MAIQSNQRAIVIGSGFGGVAAALPMCALGYDVDVLEKNADIGGRARVFHRGEHVFDAGQTVLTAPFLFRELFYLFPDLLRLRAHRSLYKMVSSYLGDEGLRRFFSIQPLLVGGNPYTPTSIYAFIHCLERRFGVWFCKGGMGAMVAALGRLFISQCGRIHTATPVAEIVVEQGRAIGVRCADEKMQSADIVVANVDPSTLCRSMIAPKWRRHWTDRRLDSLQFSMGVLVWYFRTRRRYSAIAHHTILFGADYHVALQAIFVDGRISSDLHVYPHRPTASDESLGPADGDTFYALVPVPNLWFPIDGKEAGPKLRDATLRLLEQPALPGLRDVLTEDFVSRRNISAISSPRPAAVVSRSSRCCVSRRISVSTTPPKMSAICIWGAPVHIPVRASLAC